MYSVSGSDGDFLYMSSGKDFSRSLVLFILSPLSHGARHEVGRVELIYSSSDRSKTCARTVLTCHWFSDESAE
jgi:hypothetical protein